MVNANVEELERRLDAGEWLTPGEVAKLLNVSRTKLHDMLVKKQIRWINKPQSAHRVCNPEDVRRELAAVRGAMAAASEPDDGSTVGD